jgi:hypothetical protein
MKLAEFYQRLIGKTMFEKLINKIRTMPLEFLKKQLQEAGVPFSKKIAANNKLKE